MYEVYELSFKIPVILSIVIIAAFLLKEYAARSSGSFDSSEGRRIPKAAYYYTRGGYLVQLVKRGNSFRAYVTKQLSFPELRYDRYGDYIETGCTQEEDAKLFVDYIL